jgi:hypothetical protein
MGDADPACRSSILALGGQCRAVYTAPVTGRQPTKKIIEETDSINKKF